MKPRGLRLAIAAVWLILLVAGLSRLRLDTQVLNLLPPEIPSVRGLKLYEEHFANASELIITLQGAEAATLERAARDLALKLRSHSNIVASAVGSPPWLESPQGSAELIAYLWLNQPPEKVCELSARLEPAAAAAELERTKEQLATTMSPEALAKLSYDPFRLLEVPGADSGLLSAGQGDELFASPDGTFRLLFVRAGDPIQDYRSSQRWLEELAGVIENWRASDPAFAPVVLNKTGRPAFISEISANMERDISSSVGGTMVIIAALFWWVHRRFKPLLWLLAMLVLILVSTLAAGGLVFQRLNIISAGFAAILLGLAVDYGLVLYQEFLDSPGRSPQEVRHAVGPSIFWAALTTAGAFLALNLGGLPGLAQLGTLVGLGVLIGAGVMLSLYLGPLARNNRGTAPPPPQPPPGTRLGWAVSIGLFTAGLAVLWYSPPRVDASSAALRPGNSEAFQTIEEIKTRLNRPHEPLWLLAQGANYDEAAAKLDRAAPLLDEAAERGEIERAVLPGALVPRPVNQTANRPIFGQLAARRAALEKSALDAGFNRESLLLLDQVFNHWERASGSTNLFLPQQRAGQWILEQLVSQTPGTFLALALVHPPASGQINEKLLEQIRDTGVIVAGWELLGGEVYAAIQKRGKLLAVLITGSILMCLALAFRRLGPVLLSLAALLLTALALTVVMRLFNWDWNLMNLMALPLLAGAGIDYSIHIQLALERHGGNIRQVRHSVGRALFLCSATTISGFGSLAWTENAGLASLGLICATGIAWAFIVAAWLLPIWWAALHRKSLT